MSENTKTLSADVFPRLENESELERLKRVMDKLRSPGGCPWDIEQDHISILKYLIEECYELVEAIESNDRDAMREELGDVLLQVYFHSRIAQDDATDPFDIEEVARLISEKLITRHDHVFGDKRYENNEELLISWEAQKQQEKGRKSPFDGVPLGQPALALAAKALDRLDKLKHKDVSGNSVNIAQPIKLSPTQRQELTSESFGEILLGLVDQAIALGIEPESALRNATKRFMADVESKIE